MSLLRASVSVVAMGCCLAASPAAAQQPRTPRLRGPVFSASIYGGYDMPLFSTTVTAPSTAGNPTLQPATQLFGGADANVDYTKTGRRVSLTVQANASNRYYPEFTPSSAPSYGANVSLSSMSTGRWRWSLSQFAHYSPLSGTSLFAGAGVDIANSQSVALTSATAFQVSTLRLVEVNTGASLSYAPSRRTNITFSSLVGGIVPIDSGVQRSSRLNGRLRADRQISRALRAYLGYSITQNRVDATGTLPSAAFEISGFDFGVDFARPFQLTRSTTLGFSTGLVKVPESRSQYELTGRVTLDQKFRGTWNATATAMRDARFVQAYRNAVVFLGASASVSGRLVGNLGTLTALNYSTGDINSAAGRSAIRSYSASAQLRYDIRRRVATFVEYSAFRSEIDDTTALIGFPTGSFGRHSVRGGLSFGLSPFTP